VPACLDLCDEALTIALHQEIGPQLYFLLVSIDRYPPQAADLPVDDSVALCLQQGLRILLACPCPPSPGDSPPVASTASPPRLDQQDHDDDREQNDDG